MHYLQGYKQVSYIRQCQAWAFLFLSIFIWSLLCIFFQLFKNSLNYSWIVLIFFKKIIAGHPESDCRIFKSTISLELNDEIVWFFVCLYKFVIYDSWLKFFWMEWAWSNMGLDAWHSKIGCISRTNRWNKLIFAW